MARATRSPAGARRSTVMAAPTTAIARRSMTPMTRRTTIRPAQQWLHWRPRRRPCRQAVATSAASVRSRPGVVPAAGKGTRLPRCELQSADDQHDHTDRDRYGARQRRVLHLDRSQCDAERENGNSEHRPDKEVPRRPRPRSADRGASRQCCQRPGGSATASGPGTAASSPPSSRPTCRGTTPPRRATSVRASASTPSTSPSRRASASRPSPTSTRTRRSSAPRWRRRAALRPQRRRGGTLARKPCDVAQPLLYSSWRRHQRPVSLRPLGARSSHWYMPQRPSSPRA